MDESKGMMVLGDEQVAVKTRGGFLTRVQRKVRLQYGTEVYAATPSPKPDSKCTPFQPGYMKLVAAMGGHLVCPPAVRDPSTGEVRPNPLVETIEGTGKIRRVTATAVCAVRNPVTGDPVVSTQTIVVDVETVLRQALLKMLEREDLARMVHRDDWPELRKTELKGWISYRFDAEHLIAADPRKAGVRDALATFEQQSATARQRACSKAERLAADHNPITRMSWEYGQLRRPTGGGPPYTEVSVVAWVEHGDDELSAFMGKLGGRSPASAVLDVVEQESEVAYITDGGERIDDDIEEQREDDREVVEVTAEPVQQAQQAQAEQVDRALLRARDLSIRAESGKPKAAIAKLRADMGIDPATETDRYRLGSYRDALLDIQDGE